MSVKPHSHKPNYFISPIFTNLCWNYYRLQPSNKTTSVSNSTHWHFTDARMSRKLAKIHLIWLIWLEQSISRSIKVTLLVWMSNWFVICSTFDVFDKYLSIQDMQDTEFTQNKQNASCLSFRHQRDIFASTFRINWIIHAKRAGGNELCHFTFANVCWHGEKQFVLKK